MSKKKKYVSSDMKSKLISALLSVSMISSAFTGLGSVSNSVVSMPVNAVVAEDYGLMDNCQEGVILHAWQWSFNNIKDNMEQIAQAGYTSIQTSVIQQCKESTLNKTNEYWWLYYQPANFTIDNTGYSALGTKAEFTAMCEEAHKYGIHVIVDVVSNHLGNQTGYDKSPAIPDDIRNDDACWHTNWNVNISDYDNRDRCINYSLEGLPDLNTENSKIQAYVLNYLRECIDAGADGFRFDTAKHIGTLADGSQYTYWHNIIPPAKAYYADKEDAAFDSLYCYGEFLGGGSSAVIGSLLENINLTDDVVGNNVRSAVVNKNASGVKSNLNSYQKTGATANQLVLWAESHDTYSGDEKKSTNVSDSDINKTWALVASRSDATALYFARTDGYRGGNIGDICSTKCFSNEVVAVNKFHNAFNGQSEYISQSGNIVYNERGKKGVVLVNVGGNSASVSVPAKKMLDGTYTDQITGNTFTVANGTISGTIGSTGIAVVYNPDDVSDPVITNSKFYLVPSSKWLSGNARFAMYFFNDSTNAWADMSDDDGDGIYEGNVPQNEQWKSVIFCRMNGSATANIWDNKICQTEDLFPNSGTNCYTIVDSTTKPNDDGTWSNYSENNDDGDSSISYDFTVEKAGYAQGSINFTAGAKGNYSLYWADAQENILQGYYPIDTLSMNAGQTKSITMGEHTAIPANAEKIVAVRNGQQKAVYEIPQSKKLSTASGTKLYIFSAYSDIHIDKDDSCYYVDAETHLNEGLQYAVDRGSDYFIASGDVVTNASGPDKEWTAYQAILRDSDFVNPIWESDGNHDMRQSVSSGIQSFIKHSGTDSVKGSDKPYFYKIEENTGDIFIFMALEFNKNPYDAAEFTSEQLTWAENLIQEYTAKKVNVFLIQHSPINQYGAGDRMSNPYYGGLLNTSYAANAQFKQMIQQYKNVVWFSGHTHEDFTMDYNYSNENNTGCHMIHIPSLAGSTMPNSTDDGLERNNGKGFNSQGYYTEVYQNEIICYGVNLSDKLIYPKYSYIMESSRTAASPLLEKPASPALTGNEVDISATLGQVSAILSKYYGYASYDQYQALKKLYYQYKNQTKADESVVTDFQTKINALAEHTGTINVNSLGDTYYFENNKSWSKVYGYAWDGSDQNAKWPGVQLSKAGENNGHDVYAIKFSYAGQYPNLIFNNGSSQTVDISLYDYSGNCFKLDSTTNGKYNVGNYTIDLSGETPEDPPVITGHDYALLYYVSGEHNWTDTSKLFTPDGNGKYTYQFTSEGVENLSFSLYDKTDKKYLSMAESASLSYADGETTDYTLTTQSSRGKSITVTGLTAGSVVTIVYNPENNAVSVTCGEETLSTSIPVNFVDINGKIKTVFDIYPIEGSFADVSEELVNLPSAPYLDGYEFTGWKIGDNIYDSEGLRSALVQLISQEPESVTVNEIYNRKETLYLVEVIGGTLSDGNTSGQFKASEQLFISADQASDGQKFSHWEKDGIIVGYEETYAFRMPSDLNGTTFTAKYVTKETNVNKVGTAHIESVTVHEKENTTDPTDVSVVSVVSVPDDKRILCAGVVANTEDMLNGKELTSKTTRFQSYNSTSCKNYTTFKYTFTKKNIQENEIWCVRAYLKYVDIDGNVSEVYGDVVRIDINGEVI